MTWQEFINLTAIVLGPMFAVMITLWHQERSERQRRRLEVFKALMKTRRRRLDPEHVSALNLVEIEFHRSQKIRALVADLMAVFERVEPAEHGQAHAQFWEKFKNDHDQILTRLLDQMAKELGYRFDQVEIMKGGYNPRLYERYDIAAEKARNFVAQLYDLSNGRGLPIDVVDYRTADQLRAAAEEAARHMNLGPDK